MLVFDRRASWDVFTVDRVEGAARVTVARPTAGARVCRGLERRPRSRLSPTRSRRIRHQARINWFVPTDSIQRSPCSITS